MIKLRYIEAILCNLWKYKDQFIIPTYWASSLLFSFLFAILLTDFLLILGVFYLIILLQLKPPLLPVQFLSEIEMILNVIFGGMMQYAGGVILLSVLFLYWSLSLRRYSIYKCSPESEWCRNNFFMDVGY